MLPYGGAIGILNRCKYSNTSCSVQNEYCINGGQCGEDGKWIPTKEGLGMGHIFDELNSLYGEDFIKYK